MSDADDGVLSDADAQVVEATMGEDYAENGDGDNEVETIEVPREEYEALQTTVQEHSKVLKTLLGRLHQVEKHIDGEVQPVGATTLEKYASMPEDMREDTLSTAEQVAVEIYDHWDELAARTKKGYAINTMRNSTAKYNPSRFKREIERVHGDDLFWEQVYRAMRAVARLSGGEPEPDQYGRQHVVGGDFEYHDKKTPDGKSYKLLIQREGSDR